MTLPTLYSRTSTGAIQKWTIEVDGNKYRTHHGQVDGAIQITNWTVVQGKNVGRSNATTGDEQALKDAQSLWKKKKDTGSFENIDNIDNFVFTAPMLAKKFGDFEDRLIYPVFSQPKYDGIRAIVKRDGIWSRTGKPLVATPHVLTALQPYFDKHPTGVLDGELYCDKYANDFNAICSLVKKSKPTQEDLHQSAAVIQYWVYDSIRPGLFEERTNHINSALLSCTVVRKVPTHYVATRTQLDQLYEKYLEDGYEGQMVRLNEPYEQKRTQYLLKRKQFTDNEWVIVGVEEGRGNRTGMAGKLCFINSLGHPFKVDINGPRSYLKKIWDNKEEYIGKTATIKYFNLTPEKQVPRFGKVINIDRESYE